MSRRNYVFGLSVRLCVPGPACRQLLVCLFIIYLFIVTDCLQCFDTVGCYCYDIFNLGSSYLIVVRPTSSCFADWSKRRHVTLSIFECRTIHDNLSSDIFTLRENVGPSDSLDGVSTYSHADVVCYSATCRTGLNERSSVGRSYK